MKVWIHSTFDNLPCEGFRKQRFWLMAEAFVRAGHEVTYWTGDFNHGTKAKRILSADPSAPGITVKILPAAPYAKNVSLKRAASHLRYAAEWMKAGTQEALRNRPDLVIAACPTIGVAAAALRIARKFSAVSAVDVMDAWPETFERLAPKPLRLPVKAALWPLRLRIRQIYRRADIVSGVSARYAGLTGRKDYLLAYHGVERALELAPWPGRIKGPAGTGIRLVYVGNLGNGYDLETVFKGMEELRRRGVGVSMTIAGRGPMENVYRSTAPEGVGFAGYLAEPELERLLAESDIGVIPLGDETWVGLPYKLGDYVKAGLKTVSSLGGECRDLLEGYRAGAWYRQGSPESFADAVQSLASEQGDLEGVEKLAAALDAAGIYDRYVQVCTAAAKR